MKRNLMQAVLENTQAMSEKVFDQFLIKRHGTYGRENVSSDTTLLDENQKGVDALASKVRRQRARKRA